MAAIIGSLIGVWLLLFAAWGNLHEIIPPGRMTSDGYALQYMVVGAIVCLAGAIAAGIWFSAARNLPEYGSARPVIIMVVAVLNRNIVVSWWFRS